jgi:diaminopimelate epimerase
MDDVAPGAVEPRHALAGLAFAKVESVGNDYVVVDVIGNGPANELGDPSVAARLLSDRHFGVGADGLLLMESAAPTSGERDGRTIAMRVFNADGSPGGMCGNGLRCVVKLAIERGYISADRYTRVWVEVGDGASRIIVEARAHLDAEGRVEAVTADMGEPVLDPARVPLRADDAPVVEGDHVRRLRVPAGVTTVSELECVVVSMGNPHAVVFTDTPEALLFTVGPLLERHAAFPERVNAHFVKVEDEGRAHVFSWERGSGHTLGCGSGACAVAVAGVLTNRLDRSPLIRSPGGEVTVRWEKGTNAVSLTGPARVVFEGRVASPGVLVRP